MIHIHSRHYKPVFLVMLVLLGLLGNHAWLAEWRHARFREASWRALDSLAYQADELKRYQTEATEMLFHGDGKPLADTFLLAAPSGTVYTFDDWLESFCPELMAQTTSGEAGEKTAPAAGLAAASGGAHPGVPVAAGGGRAAEGRAVAVGDTLRETPPDGAGRSDPFVVVFRYTELDCMTCAERQIELMQQVCAAHPQLKCVILASYAYDALLWQFVRMNQLELPIFQVPSDAVYGGVGVPFYFVLDRSRRYHHAFVPHKRHDEWTVAYLNSLAEEAERR